MDDDNYMEMSAINMEEKKGAEESDKKDRSLKDTLMKNALPGLTVALVSIPLSTALSIAAGATPDMGLRAAIYGPALGGILGGSDFNILGPAGALVNILKVYSGTYGTEIVPWLAIVSGIMALLVWATKLERYCTIIPNSVLEGFSFSVALVIGLGQTRNAFGITQTIKDAIAAKEETATSVFYELVA